MKSQNKNKRDPGIVTGEADDLSLRYPVNYQGPIKIVLERPAISAPAGTICRKSGSRKLYINFRYFGERVIQTTGLNDRPRNQAIAQAILNEIFWLMGQGLFRFAVAFPNATEERKAFFTKKEGREYHPEPDQVIFQKYVEHWEEEYLGQRTFAMQNLSQSCLRSHLLPYFGALTFYEITRPLLRKFLAQLRNKNGEALSRKRVSNIMLILRGIWLDAVDVHHWELKFPFKDLYRYYPKGTSEQPEVFRFDDIMAVIENMDPFYQPIAELYLLTGAIHSEFAGLKKTDIRDGFIHFERSRNSKNDQEGPLKTDSRHRATPITKAIQKRLDILLPRSESPYLLVMHDGRPYNGDVFREKHWRKSFKGTGVKYRKPYALRHTFAAWCLTIETDMNRVVDLMGHASKEMVYEVYGHYVEGLEMDGEKILAFFGSDFVRKKSPSEATRKIARKKRSGTAGEK